MNMRDKVIELLQKADIRPTSNRILVLKAILLSESPMSLGQLEEQLQTLEKSSVLRVLSLLLERGVIHTLEDGRGITRYELCCGSHCHDGSSARHDSDDLHAHFYCQHCRRVFCFHSIEAPIPTLPPGYKTLSVNFMIKGICPDCTDK